MLSIGSYKPEIILMVLHHICTTSYFPIKNPILGCFIEIEYEHLGYVEPCLIKAKCQNIKDLSSSGYVTFSIDEIFYIDTLNELILNKDREVLATSTLAKKRL